MSRETPQDDENTAPRVSDFGELLLLEDESAPAPAPRPTPSVPAAPNPQRPSPIQQLERQIEELETKLERNLENGYQDYLVNGQFTDASYRLFDKDKLLRDRLQRQLNSAYRQQDEQRRSAESQKLARDEARRAAYKLASGFLAQELPKRAKALHPKIKENYAALVRSVDWGSDELRKPGAAQSLLKMFFNNAWAEANNEAYAGGKAPPREPGLDAASEDHENVDEEDERLAGMDEKQKLYYKGIMASYQDRKNAHGVLADVARKAREGAKS